MPEAIEVTPAAKPLYRFTHEELAAITEARRKFLNAMELHNVAVQTGASPEIVAVLDKEWRRLMDAEGDIQSRFLPEGHVHPSPFALLPFEKPITTFQRAMDLLKARVEAASV